MDFVHLHTHTDYSPLDGMGTIEKLVTKAKELGQHALAITDHGNMFGTYAFWKECKKQSIQPIFGCEFYHAVAGIDKRFHLVCLAKSMTGLRNLYKLHEIASNKAITGSFGRVYPIITYEDLFEHKEDVIVLTACIGGHIPYMILNNDDNGLYTTIEMLKQRIGDNLFLELQSNSIPEQATLNSKLVEISLLYGIKTVLTNDIHYTEKEDAKIHEMLLCIQTQTKMSNAKRMKFSVYDFWLKSKTEMIESSTVSIEETVYAINNTVEIANMCNFEYELPSKQDILPKFSNDENKTLRKIVTDGWHALPHGKTKLEKDRADFELKVIEDKGYAGYFCIVSDYIQHAKNNGVLVGKGRGSVVGSFVSYLAGITGMNPLDYDLLFERFLNPERNSAPDIDIDFSDQQFVFDYLKEKWGDRNVSLIMAFGRLTAKSVFSKILSIHDFDNTKIKTWTKSFPQKLELKLKDCENTDAFVYLRKFNPELVNAMYRLEGVIDHITKHSAGVLIVPNNISNYMPVVFDKTSNMMVAGYDKYMLESLGFFKFDVLKLNTLNVIEDTISLVKKHDNINIDLSSITSYDDVNIYKSLTEGNVFGVFQFETQAPLVKLIKPKNFKVLTDINALIRPGSGKEYIARMNGQSFEYYADEEKYYMQQTHNVLIYQEQVMMRVKTLAGWSLGKGDSLRKEKNILTNTELAEQYYADCKTLGICNEEFIVQSWQDICEIIDSGYGFNLSHATSYSALGYETAWLQYYYPLYFMCALMKSEEGSNDYKAILAERLLQCKNLGIDILLPNINSIENSMSIENGCIRLPLTLIEGLGDIALNSIHEIQPINSFDDFYGRINKSKCNEKATINLIKSGCFYDSNADKLDLIKHYLTLKKEKNKIKEYNVMEYTRFVDMQFESEAFGVYVTATPFDDYAFLTVEEQLDENVVIGGTILLIKQITDRNGKLMCFLKIATQHEVIDVTIFNSSFFKAKPLLVKFNLVVVYGRKSKGGILLDRIRTLDDFITSGGEN